MSYLDVPRLHFAGTFTANPSTINNTIDNYDPMNLKNGKIDLSWNPYGSHLWTIAATVRSFVDPSGRLRTSGDPLIGATCNSVDSKHAKLVDLDTDQQGRSRLYGLDLQLAAGATELLTAHYDEPSTLLNLWVWRVPTESGDNAAGGAFQSVLHPTNVANLATASPFLKQLLDVSPDGLSIRLSTFGFQAHHEYPTFRSGTIYGTIGPWRQGETRYNAVERMLNPPAPDNKTLLWYTPFKVDSRRQVVTLDVGNSVADQKLGGPPVDLGTLEVQVNWPAHGGWQTLGTIPTGNLAQTAGVVEVSVGSFGALTPPLMIQMETTPLRVVGRSGQTLKESDDGLYVEMDGATYYMNPGDPAKTATVCATRFGKPAAGVAVPLSLIEQTQGSVSLHNNEPAGAIQFPASVSTGTDGKAPISFTATNPVPKPLRRVFVDGQVYFIGGPWASGANAMAGAPLSIKVYNKVEPPIANPVWKDVQPILYQYYYLYGYMASMVDMSNYEEVKGKKIDIAYVMSLPDTDPGFMPVTREMSADQRQLILTWIKNDCPQ